MELRSNWEADGNAGLEFCSLVLYGAKFSRSLIFALFEDERWSANLCTAKMAHALFGR